MAAITMRTATTAAAPQPITPVFQQPPLGAEADSIGGGRGTDGGGVLMPRVYPTREGADSLRAPLDSVRRRPHHRSVRRAVLLSLPILAATLLGGFAGSAATGLVR